MAATRPTEARRRKPIAQSPETAFRASCFPRCAAHRRTRRNVRAQSRWRLAMSGTPPCASARRFGILPSSRNRSAQISGIIAAFASRFHEMPMSPPHRPHRPRRDQGSARWSDDLRAGVDGTPAGGAVAAHGHRTTASPRPPLSQLSRSRFEDRGISTRETAASRPFIRQGIRTIC